MIRVLIVATAGCIAGCASAPWSAPQKDPPPVVQCDADLLKPCDPLIADASDSVADALIADAENNGRMISCQLAQRALAECLCKLERGGIVKPREGVQSVCSEQPRGASPAPADRARGPPQPARGTGPAE